MYVVGAGSDIAAQRKGKLYITLIQEAQLHPPFGWMVGWRMIIIIIIVMKWLFIKSIRVIIKIKSHHRYWIAQQIISNVCVCVGMCGWIIYYYYQTRTKAPAY